MSDIESSEAAKEIFGQLRDFLAADQREVVTLLRRAYRLGWQDGRFGSQDRPGARIAKLVDEWKNGAVHVTEEGDD